MISVEMFFFNIIVSLEWKFKNIFPFLFTDVEAISKNLLTLHFR